jgi:hypothetical protein
MVMAPECGRVGSEAVDGIPYGIIKEREFQPGES